jgi:hypothetical protein
MKYTKQEIETRLNSMLYDMLSDYNQESAILNLVYDDKTETCNVVLSVHIVEEDDYIGFDGY